MSELKTYGEMSMEELIHELSNVVNTDGNKLEWATLCKATKFDSFITMLTFGTQWQDSNLETMPIEHVRMALYNITNYPKEITT